MPAPPKPAMARPRMKTIEFVADPQIAEPISKTRMLVKKVLKSSLRSVTCPLAHEFHNDVPLLVVELINAAENQLGTGRRQHV